jgi:hypothetical protein
MIVDSDPAAPTPVVYTILDNGAQPCTVRVYGTRVDVVAEDGSVLWSSPYARVFVGDNWFDRPRYIPCGLDPGNTLLVELPRDATESPPTESPPTESPPTESPPTESPPTESPPTESPPTESPFRYVHIGCGAFAFEARRGDRIESYASPVGNNDVPYPFALGRKYVYYLLDQVTLPRVVLDYPESGYDEFYAHYRDRAGMPFAVEPLLPRFFGQ